MAMKYVESVVVLVVNGGGGGGGVVCVFAVHIMFYCTQTQFPPLAKIEGMQQYLHKNKYLFFSTN